MRTLTTIAAFTALGVSALAAPPVPRIAKPAEMIDGNGMHHQLATYKGKVVVIQWLFTTCSHCQAYSQLLSKLQTEYGPRGFQALGYAFNDGVDAAAVRSYVSQFHVNFPVGIPTMANAPKDWTPRDMVLSFMDFSSIMRLVVPQVALIDRKGMIIEQTEQDPTDQPQLQVEAHLRAAIEKALGPAGAGAGKATPTSTGAKKKADATKKPAS